MDEKTELLNTYMRANSLIRNNLGTEALKAMNSVLIDLINTEKYQSAKHLAYRVNLEISSIETKIPS
jgi:hypothetical protein